MKIEFCDKIFPEINELLEAEFQKYETENQVSCDFKHFCIIAKENNEILGALTGMTFFSEAYIDELLVLPKHRRQGIGRKLLSYLEEHFKKHNFTNISLDTREFQAPEFYKKCGYSLEFVRKNPKFPKFTKYFFVKWLI